MFSHVMIGANDLEKAKVFYDAIFRARSTCRPGGSTATGSGGGRSARSARRARPEYRVVKHLGLFQIVGSDKDVRKHFVWCPILAG